MNTYLISYYDGSFDKLLLVKEQHPEAAGVAANEYFLKHDIIDPIIHCMIEIPYNYDPDFHVLQAFDEEFLPVEITVVE